MVLQQFTDGGNEFVSKEFSILTDKERDAALDAHNYLVKAATDPSDLISYVTEQGVPLADMYCKVCIHTLHPLYSSANVFYPPAGIMNIFAFVLYYAHIFSHLYLFL